LFSNHLGLLYTIELTRSAADKLQQQTSKVSDRITDKLNWLAINFPALTPLPLTGDLAGLYKLRVDDYRVIYSFDPELQIITVHNLGHRREIYE